MKWIIMCIIIGFIIQVLGYNSLFFFCGLILPCIFAQFIKNTKKTEDDVNKN